jgi:hypothetical protein
MRSEPVASVPVEKPVKADPTFPVSVTSALASMPSSFVPSAATSRPSMVPLAAILPEIETPVLLVVSFSEPLWYNRTASVSIKRAE